ncbi:MAG: hypothetical protein US49_C0012G0014 [candidate division TM6 bacterium GW2011_GWF2_37_49]|nr:MAG: hypothetical protein US49_C0012G0014 [candidate division TM6 bacterium GW2011_GWF2_37_49]
MSKTLQKRGKSTAAAVEINIISKKGFWISVNEQEFFLPFSEYPWFRKATIEQIYDLQLLHGDHLYWKNLDVDLDVNSLKNPEAYPLKFY